MKYLYTGFTDQPYPDILVPNGDEAPKVLIAHPGDVQEFETPPTDGRWVEVTEPPVRPTIPVKPLQFKE